MTGLIPADMLERIKHAFTQGNYLISEHAQERMDERSVSPSELRAIVLNGWPIEYDPDGGDHAQGILFNGQTSGGRPLHVKVGERNRGRTRYFVVTVYEPDSAYFENNFSVRRTGTKKGWR